MTVITAPATAPTFMPLADDALRHLASAVDEIGLDVATSYTLADAIREGSGVTAKANGWGDGRTACALSAGYLAALARGYAT